MSRSLRSHICPLEQHEPRANAGVYLDARSAISVDADSRTCAPGV